MSLPLPPHYNPEGVAELRRIPYEQLAASARSWAADHNIRPAAGDDFRTALVVIDMQNTFCLPDFELYVGGRSGTGAVGDTSRLCRFIYQNLDRLTQITVSLDTHSAMQIFHAVFLVDEDGNHPGPMTLVTAEDIEAGRWRFNPALAGSLQVSGSYGQEHLAYYTRQLKEKGKYDLTIWPYHAMLGSLGHALVPAFEEAVFFHSIARYSPTDFIVKGDNPFTEHYSAVGPEVTIDAAGHRLAARSIKFLQIVQDFDAVLVAGEAKSHCVVWTLNDMLADIQAVDPALAGRVYLLEDCTSPVVVPGVVDFTDAAGAAFERLAAAGMHVIQSTSPFPAPDSGRQSGNWDVSPGDPD